MLAVRLLEEEETRPCPSGSCWLPMWQHAAVICECVLHAFWGLMHAISASAHSFEVAVFEQLVQIEDILDLLLVLGSSKDRW